jgi:O-antigen/teichoic acid export membrane protein
MGSTLSYSLFYYLQRSRDETERRTVVSTSMLGAMALGGAATAIGWLASPFLGRLVFSDAGHTDLLRAGFFTVAASMPLEMGFACLRGQDRPVTFTIASLARLAGMAAAALIGLTVLHLGIWAIVYANLVSTWTLAVWIAVSCLKGAPLRFRWELFRSQVCYSGPVILVTLSQTVLHAGDRFFLLRTASVWQVGIYSLAYKCGMLISYLQQAISSAWSVEVFRVLDGPAGVQVYSRIFTYFSMTMVYAGLIISLTAGPAIRVMINSQYHAAIDLIPWVVLAYVIRGSADFFRGVLYVAAKTAWDARATLAAAAVALTGYAVLIPAFSLAGAVAATILGFALLAVYSWNLARKARAIALDYVRLAKIYGAGAAVTAAVHAAGSAPPAVQAAAAAAGIAAYPLLLWATGCFLPAEIGALRGWARRGWARAKGGSEE